MAPMDQMPRFLGLLLIFWHTMSTSVSHIPTIGFAFRKKAGPCDATRGHIPVSAWPFLYSQSAMRTARDICVWQESLIVL